MTSSGRVTGRSVLATFGIWLGASAVLGTATWFGVTALTGSDSQTPTLAVVLLVYLLLPVSAVVVYRPAGVRDALAVRPVPWRTIGHAVIAWAITLAVLAAGYALWGLAIGDPTGPLAAVVQSATDFSRFSLATPVDWVLIVVRALVLAGITEELIFRGILFGWLRPKLPWWAVALITACLFAVIHYFPVLIPVGVVLGILLAWLRERSGSIVPGIVVHWLTDWLLFAVALVMSLKQS